MFVRRSQRAWRRRNYAKPFKPLVPQDQIAEFAALHFYEMVALRSAKSWAKLKQSSRETLSFIESLNGCSKTPRIVTDAALKQIESFARDNLVPSVETFTPIVPGWASRKYGRNQLVTVRYRDGTVKRGVKFKKIKADLVERRCVVLDESPK